MKTGQKNPCEKCTLRKTRYRKLGLCRCTEWKDYFRFEWAKTTGDLKKYQDEIERIKITARGEE